LLFVYHPLLLNSHNPKMSEYNTGLSNPYLYGDHVGASSEAGSITLHRAICGSYSRLPKSYLSKHDPSENSLCCNSFPLNLNRFSSFNGATLLISFIVNPNG